MKKHFQKLMAAMMALAMTLGLCVSASASADPVTALGDNGVTATLTNSVATQGGLPTDVIHIVVPTVSNNNFDIILDAYDLIQTTNAEAFEGTGTGGATPVFAKGTKFYFKNTKDEAVPVTENAPKENVDTIVYTKPADVKVYAKYDDDGDFEKWLKVDGAEMNATAVADFPYKAIAAMITEDPLLGSGKDTIADLNETTFIDFKKTGTGAADATVEAIRGLDEYTFKDYESDLLYLDEENVKVYSAVGASASEASTVASAYNQTELDAMKTALTTAGYEVKKELFPGVVSYSAVSDDIKVINKSNKIIGVSVAAELAGVDGSDGKFIYAAKHTPASVDASGNAVAETFSDKDDKEITKGAIFYFALTDGTDTEAMTYESGKGTVKFESSIAGSPDKYTMGWVPATADTAGHYAYTANDDVATADFPSVAFHFEGAINQHADWKTLGSTPSLKVTWTVKNYALIAPTVEQAASFIGTKPWTINVTANKSAAILDSAKWYASATDTTGTEFTPTENTDATTGGTSSFTMPKGTFSAKPYKIDFKFKDQADETLTVTSSYIVP